MGEITASIQIDAAKINEQLCELKKLLNFPASSFENIPHHFIDLIFSHFSSLIDNIIISNISTTFGAGNSVVTVFSVEIGGEVERCAAAIRALKLNLLTHKNIPN